MSPNLAIEIYNLSKRYTSNAPFAVKDLSIQVAKGEVYGFLGPNGAGKSTTIRMLLNFIQPSGGQATINGLDTVKDAVSIKRSLGYLSGDFSAYSKMTGQQFLDYMQALQPPKRKTYARELARSFDVNLNKKVNTLSKGNKQKIGLIQALMHEPDVLILDEPTDGLDPLMQEVFYELIKQQKAKGVTAFVSSHNLAEVKKMCTKVAIIKNGRLVQEDDIANLALEASQTFDITFNKPVPLGSIKKISGVVKATATGKNSVTIHHNGDLSPLLGFLAKQSVASMSTHELNLETEFMKYYETENNR